LRRYDNYASLHDRIAHVLEEFMLEAGAIKRRKLLEIDMGMWFE
jgi:hypothetical protein